MTIETLEQLYIDQLEDLHSAEGQLVAALPKVAAAASSPRLKKAIAEHSEDTRRHRTSLVRLLKGLDGTAGGKKCIGMEGLIEEAAEVIEGLAEGPVRDAALIAAAQRIEYYEIASYGTACEFAQVLGRPEDFQALSTILDEEKAASRTLREIAASEVNRSERARRK